MLTKPQGAGSERFLQMEAGQLHAQEYVFLVTELELTKLTLVNALVPSALHYQMKTKQ